VVVSGIAIIPTGPQPPDASVQSSDNPAGGAESWGAFVTIPDALVLAHRHGTPAAVQRATPPGRAPGPGALAVEPSALRSEIERLKEERRADQAELHDLRRRIQELERKLDDLLVTHDVDPQEIPVDPHTRWIEDNLDELRKYPDAFVALDPDRGILAHATENGEFAAKLEALTPEERERVTLFHTSMYLRA
jgi:hypothetical protein